jgi:hypothetical protein
MVAALDALEQWFVGLRARVGENLVKKAQIGKPV